VRSITPPITFLHHSIRTYKFQVSSSLPFACVCVCVRPLLIDIASFHLLTERRIADTPHHPFNPHTNTVQLPFAYGGPECDEAIDMAFSKKKVEDRKTWLRG
jgi:hypothetical protein